MHSRWRCKICFCSLILGELEAFRNYKGFCVIFPKSLDAIEHFTKLAIFVIPHSTVIFESESFRFPLSTMIRLKSVLQKIVGNFLDKLRKLFPNGTLESFSFIQAYKIQGDIFFIKQIYFTEKIYMYIETHCKHRRKKIYLRWAIAIDRKDHSMYSSSDPLYTEKDRAGLPDYHF